MIRRLFSREKNKALGTPAPSPKTDLHSHLIPGIDDGSKNMEDSLEMLKGMQALGYERVITTPHIMSDAYNNSSKIIIEGLRQLRKAAAAEGINIAIGAAAEYYMDEELLSRLERKDILTIGGEYLLFETSYISKPLNFKDTIYEIQARGYKAMLAHPERYRYISNPAKEFEEMKNLEIYFQLDINSISGYYGKDAMKNAQVLSDAGMIDFLGSDIHRIKQVDFLKKVFADEKYQKLLENNKILNETL